MLRRTGSATGDELEQLGCVRRKEEGNEERLAYQAEGDERKPHHEQVGTSL